MTDGLVVRVEHLVGTLVAHNIHDPSPEVCMYAREFMH